MRILLYLFGLISSLMFTAGVVFRLLHFPEGDFLFNVGFISFTLGFIPMLTYGKYAHIQHDKLKSALYLLGGFSSFITGLSVVFKLQHLFGADKLLLLGFLIFAIGYLPLLFYSLYKSN